MACQSQERTLNSFHMNTVYIAVHGGAGVHHPSSDKAVKRALRRYVSSSNEYANKANKFPVHVTSRSLCFGGKQLPWAWKRQYQSSKTILASMQVGNYLIFLGSYSKNVLQDTVQISPWMVKLNVMRRSWTGERATLEA